MNYEQILKEIDDRIDFERDVIANTSNVSAILHIRLNEAKNNCVNWTGFYFTRRVGQLCLGPFQGKPACIRINFGDGVCGTAAQSKESQVVENVHEFPGHIACDGASNSEIVVPILRNGDTVGVIDIDSSELSTFDDDDRKGIEKIAELLSERCDWDQIEIEE